MGLIQHLAEIYEQSRIEYEQQKSGAFRLIERSEAGNGEKEERGVGMLAHGDNAACMRWLLSEKELDGKVQLIYLDPPFFSKANYEAIAEIPLMPDKDAKAGSESEKATAKTRRVRHRAYEDVWETGMEAYLRTCFACGCCICATSSLMRAPFGCIWTGTACIMSKSFWMKFLATDNFVNEIIWQYKSGGSSKRHFARKHDTILVYSKTPRYYLQLPKEKSYNRGLKPYRFKGVEEFCDERGWYTVVNMKDVWNIDMVGRTSAERTGYATQKPEALLLRILEAGSRPDDLVCDFFCGSGTLGAVAGKCGRRWICCDNGAPAAAGALKRFQREGLAVELVAEETICDALQDVEPKIRIAAELSREPYTSGFQTEPCKVTVRLSAYQLTEMSENLRSKARADIEAALAKDVFALVDYWCVDDQYDGKIFCARHFAARVKGKLELSLSWEAEAQSRQAAMMVKAVDVFGNTAFYALQEAEPCSI